MVVVHFERESSTAPARSLAQRSALPIWKVLWMVNAIPPCHNSERIRWVTPSWRRGGLWVLTSALQKNGPRTISDSAHRHEVITLYRRLRACERYHIIRLLQAVSRYLSTSDSPLYLVRLLEYAIYKANLPVHPRVVNDHHEVRVLNALASYTII